MEQLFTHVDLKLAVFTFSIKAKDSLYLPEQKGSTFRGGMGTALARLCRDKSKRYRCQDCPENVRCPYASLFTNPASAAQSPPLEAANLPHPFVLRPPRTAKEHFEPGEYLDFQLILFGNYSVYLPFYIYAIDLFGENGIGKGRGRFDLCQVVDAVSGKEVYNHLERSPTNDFSLIRFSDLQKRKYGDMEAAVQLDFLSTTCILHQNRPAKNLSFELLVRSLLRRASNLSVLYEGNGWDLDYSTLLGMANERVPLHHCHFYLASWERFSSSQNRHTPMEGFRGTAIYKGDLAAFLPLLFLGEYMHVGSKTTFGMGQYITSTASQ